MKSLKVGFWMVLVGILILPAASVAETVYVSEDFEITMRTGPGSDRKIISLVQSGRALNILDKGEEWSKVRDPNGKEGWVLNRYITPSQPCAMVLGRVRQDFDVLTAKYEDLKGNFDQLNSQKKATDADLSQNQKDRDELSTAYETLKKDSADFLKLKQRHKQVTADLEAEKTLAAKLDEENMQLKRSRIIQWVLTGGGIMLLGFFIGLFSSSRRKSRSSLY
ncbi:TIGR04211 family SH3 domain-containing protein [Desulfosarcina sp.]|uniref:TIGR04211 family SH3 domain-containing protein n=1 Tax=Desulfosarcina sp. TaxID=2027861 RepID=UPI0029A4C732|nr:TIGR04211 family SH3 domain-containing protein [Desulfosarcina sp.]MDX2453430.1 TIGR04211 family SH3 domain-containing protein [Desulfosarcina sp.]MDX2491144.1 TIGR04211 family SH3 domain-containing protein [Desulfosarcina sp.]